MIVLGSRIQVSLDLTLILYAWMIEFQHLGPSEINLSAFVGSQALQLPKDSQINLASASRENWGESSMAEASPRTDTSTDDTDDKNQGVYDYKAIPILIHSLLSDLLVFCWGS